MEDLFEYTESEFHSMPKEEFIEKAKKVLNEINNLYTRSYLTKIVTDSLRPEESVCEACKGCGTIKDESGGELDCYQDREEGDCYYKIFDAENFGFDIEERIDQVWDLISVDKLT